MNDLISRQAAIDALGDIHPLDYNAQAYKARIEKLPSAEVTLCHLDSPCEYQNADIAMPSAQPDVPDTNVGDTISRQAAIALAKDICVPNKDGTVYKHRCIDPGAIRELPSAQQWIPVTERLPKPIAPSQRREWFITSNQYGGVTLTCYEFEAGPFKEGWQTDMTILAWMPLPEPWKGEEG